MDKDKIDRNLAAYLAGEMEEQNWVEMKREIQKDKGMQEEIDDYSKLWDKSLQLSKIDKIDVDGDWQKVRQRMHFAPKSKKIPLRKYMLRISAILVLAFGLVYILNTLVKQVNDKTSTDYFQVVAQAELKTVDLPDGSVVTLNKHSSLIYNNNFGAENRDVILEGEAFFDVARNEALAFKVFASNSTIEVLGTSFNVNASDERVSLSVVTGHVAFFETIDKVNRVELIKDEMIDYHSKEKRFTDKAGMNPNVIAWKTRRLEFRAAPMIEVLNTVSEFYGLELSLKNNIDFKESITASFDDPSLDEVLKVLDEITVQEFSANKKNNKLVVSIKK